jgi:hypothetical protein
MGNKDMHGFRQPSCTCVIRKVKENMKEWTMTD